MQNPPKGFVVLWVGGFLASELKVPETDKTIAVLIPRSDVATLEKAKKLFFTRTEWFTDGREWDISYIETNTIAYGNIFARIEKNDWERMCKLEAFDHIYVNEDIKEYRYDIRVSQGPWKVEL